MWRMGKRNKDTAPCNTLQILHPDVSPICEQHKEVLGIIMSQGYMQFLQMRAVRKDMTSTQP